MRPRPHQHPHRPLLARGQADVVVAGRARVRIVPAADNQRRHIGKVVPEQRRRVAGVLPVVVVIGPGQQIERPLFVGRHHLELGLPLAQRHPRQPIGKTRRPQIQRPLARRISLEFLLRIGRRVPERPRQKAQLQRAPLPDRRFVGVRPAHIGHHRLEIRRPQRCHGRLRPPRPRRPPRPHLPVAPRLLIDPHQRVVAVLRLWNQKIDISPRAKCPPAVLIDRHVTALRKEPPVAPVALDITFVVGRAMKDRWKLSFRLLAIPRRKVQIRRQLDPVPHRHHHILCHNHIVEYLSHIDNPIDYKCKIAFIKYYYRSLIYHSRKRYIKPPTIPTQLLGQIRPDPRGANGSTRRKMGGARPPYNGVII